MFISVQDLFKIGIGPSSSHTPGSMVAANDFINRIKNQQIDESGFKAVFIQCTLNRLLKKSHATDRAVALGLHGHLPASLAEQRCGGPGKRDLAKRSHLYQYKPQYFIRTCIEKGLETEGCLPGGLFISRRAKDLYEDLKNNPQNANIND